jgi:hypothetical protein
MLKTESKVTNNYNQLSIELLKESEEDYAERNEPKIDEENESNDDENVLSSSNHTKNNKRPFNVDSLLAPEKNPSKKFHYEQESNFSAQKSTQRERLNHNFKSKANGNVANHASSKHQNQPLNLSNKHESSNQDVEKWKETFSKIMARSYKNHK